MISSSGSVLRPTCTPTSHCRSTSVAAIVQQIFQDAAYSGPYRTRLILSSLSTSICGDCGPSVVTKNSRVWLVTPAVVMLLVATSSLLGTYLTEVQAPQELARAVSDFTKDPLVVLMLLNILFLFLGMFLHSAAAIILVVPVVMPLVKAVGIDPVHFGLIVTINLGIGQQTPPVASVLATACSIAKEDVWAVTRANLPFLGVLVAVLMICTYVPAVPMWLVNVMYG